MSHLSHTSSKLGAVTTMAWTLDGCCLAFAWTGGGFSLWSVFGALLHCSFGGSGWDEQQSFVQKVSFGDFLVGAFMHAHKTFSMRFHILSRCTCRTYCCPPADNLDGMGFGGFWSVDGRRKSRGYIWNRASYSVHGEKRLIGKHWSLRLCSEYDCLSSYAYS